MKKRVCIALATLLAVACSTDDSLEITSSDEMGRISFSLQSNSVVEMTTTTRADDVDGYTIAEELIPTESDFDITIYSVGDDEALTLYGKYDSIDAYNTAEEDENDSSVLVPPYLPAGNYTASITNKYDISIESATNACFAGSADFTVVARNLDLTATIEATLQNAIVRIKTTDAFNDYFEGGATLTLTTKDGAELTVKYPLDDDSEEQILFVVPGTSLYLSGTAIKQDPGNGTQPEVTFTKNSVGTATATSMNTIIVDAEDVGQGSIIITLDDTITYVGSTDVDLNDAETNTNVDE